MNTNRIIHLQRINRKLDPVINFDYGDDDDQKKRGLLGTAALGTGAAGVGAAGLYAGGLYRRGVPASGLTAAAGRDVSDVARGASGALPEVGRSIAAGARGVAAGAKGAVSGGKALLQKLIAAAKGVRMSTKQERLVRLNSILAERIEFAEAGTAFLLGNPAAAAINARKGKKLAAYKDAYGNAVVDTSIGGGIGSLTGAAGGAGLALAGPRKWRAGAYKALGKGLGGRGAYRAITAGLAGAGGAVAGGLVGAEAGAAHGTYGKRAQELRHRYD